MIAGVLFAALAAATPPLPGCADHWTVALDRQSFDNNGAGRTFSAAQLSAFRTKIDAQLKLAIGAACRGGQVKPARAKAVRRVEVSSASGATEPTLFQASGGKLRFEWIFAEEKLAIPPAKEIVAGAECWTDPDSGACGD